MSDGDELRDFAADLHGEVDDRLRVEPGVLADAMFARIVSERLIDDGALEDVDICYLRTQVGNRHLEVFGYNLSDGETVLDLVTCQYGSLAATISRDEIERLIRRASNVAVACRDGLHRRLEESSPAFDMAERIHASWESISEIRIFVLTDGRSTFDRLEPRRVADLPATCHLWDIVRLHRLVTSGRMQEEIIIDFTEVGAAVPCLESPEQADGYRCLLAVLPGQLLADLYGQYHDRLLQRNVRAYLQSRGKVNKDINATISKTPGRFLAYNNGISATATDAELVRLPDGSTGIARLRDLQIVNGGQTTASLHHAATRIGLDLSDVHVMTKITVVPSALLDELVPMISRYANSQNAIRPADFEANGAFHVTLERLSRSVWAPATGGSTRPTKWYYERARGQYQVERSRSRTVRQRREFEAVNPPAQRFTKTDAAKFEMAYLLRPDIVSLGAEKCFLRWTEMHNPNDALQPDVPYFQHLVAKGILFIGTRRLIMDLKLGGYLAQTAAYAMALLVSRLGDQLDLDSVWRLQELPPSYADMVPDAALTVREVLVSPPGSANVTEWCKKSDCWLAVDRVMWTPGKAG